MFKTWSITEKTSFLVPLGNPGAAVRGRVPQLGHGRRAAAPSGGSGGLVCFLLFLRAPRDPGLPFPSPPGPRALLAVSLVSADCRVPGVHPAAFAGTRQR